MIRNEEKNGKETLGRGFDEINNDLNLFNKSNSDQKIQNCKIAAIFPGQGVQYVGMGKSFYNNYEVMKRTYKEASDILGYDIGKLCFEGRITELSRNEKLFPAVLTTTLGIFRCYLDRYGIWPDYFLGHSLGEYGALTASGVIEFSDALKLVELRGELTNKSRNYGNMSIVDHISEPMLVTICNELKAQGEDIHISCYNSNSQFAVSGREDSVRKMEEEVAKRGANITPLMNSGPLHSPCMEPYCDEFIEYLKKVKIIEGEFMVIDNVTAKSIGYVTRKGIIERLCKHLISPVKWRQSIEEVCKYDQPIFIEMGAKAYARNLVSEIFPESKTYCMGIKCEQEMMDNDENMKRMQKYSNDFFERASMIGLTVLPNQNLNCDVSSIANYADRINQLKNNCNQYSKPNIEVMKEVIGLLREIMKEKAVENIEQDYWIRTIQMEYNFC